MTRTPLIAGNWKMHATHLEAIQMVQKLSYRLDPADYERVEVVVHPPFTALRSVQTVIEEFGPELPARRIAWIGDGNNMANSWINAAWRLGFELRLACPAGYDPDPTILARAGANVTLTRDPAEAAEGADVVTTDVWASMGQESEQAERARAFAGFVVDDALMKSAESSAIFLHCLPAHRGEEVSAGAIDGPASRVWRQAENRMHSARGLLAWILD